MMVGRERKKKRKNKNIIEFFFFFNDTATTEIYTLSLHDALPIWVSLCVFFWDCGANACAAAGIRGQPKRRIGA